MDGRGANSGIRSSDFKEGYQAEMSVQPAYFDSSFVTSEWATKDSIVYEMNSYQTYSGRSPIASAHKEIEALKRSLKEQDEIGTSYGASKDYVDGVKKGIKEKIKKNEKALNIMMGLKDEYAQYQKNMQVIDARAKRLKGRWM